MHYNVRFVNQLGNDGVVLDGSDRVLEARVMLEMADVLDRTRGQIVERVHRMILLDQQVAQVRTDEARASGYEESHRSLSSEIAISPTAPPHDHTAEATEHEDRDATTEQREDRSVASGGAVLRGGTQNCCGNNRCSRRPARHRRASGPRAIPYGPFGRGYADRGQPSRAPGMDARSERRSRGGAPRRSACLARLIEGQRVLLGRGRAWIDMNAGFQA